LFYSADGDYFLYSVVLSHLDIYDNKKKYENFINNLDKLLINPEKFDKINNKKEKIV